MFVRCTTAAAGMNDAEKLSKPTTLQARARSILAIVERCLGWKVVHANIYWGLLRSRAVMLKRQIIPAGFFRPGMEIAPGGRDGLVPKRVAHCGKIGAAAQSVRAMGMPEEMRGDRRLNAGQSRGALDALPCIAGRHRKDAIVSVRFFSSQHLEFDPDAAREAHDARFAPFAADVGDAVDEIAPTQSRQLGYS